MNGGREGWRQVESADSGVLLNDTMWNVLSFVDCPLLVVFSPGKIVQAPSVVSQAHVRFFTEFNGAVHAFDVVPKAGGPISASTC